MFNTFEAAIDYMEKYEFGGYIELIFISYIVLDIQWYSVMLGTALFDSLPKM